MERRRLAQLAPALLRASRSAAGDLEVARPYNLRHSFVSLLLAEGAPVIEVAQQASHAPTMTLDTYGT